MKIDTTNWKEFRVGDLFIPYLGTNPSKSQIFSSGKYAVISASSDNNGILGYTDCYQDDLVFSNIITLGNRGSYNAFYHPYDVYLGNNVLALKEKVEMTENQKLFITTLINKFHYDGYTNYPTKTNIVDEMLLLPVIDPDTPDFDYVEDYIEEMKFKYIDKLEKDNDSNIDKALEVTGLSYEDLNKDLIVEPADRYEEFRVGDLFNGVSGDTDIKQHHINDKGLPVITSGLTNNGFLGLSDVSAKVVPKNTITVDMFGNAFYRNYDYKMVTHARVFALNPKFNMSDNVGLYFATMLFYLSKKFNYSNMCSYEKIKDDVISLPAIDEDTPDFDYMEKAIYIYILQKRLSLKSYLMKKK